MNIYSLGQIVNIARTHSVIYQKLYAQLQPQASYELTKLPILSNEQLMEIVHDEKPDFVFAEGNTHGLIFESSASTGKAKVTLFGRDEWDAHARLLASQHWKNGLLKDNDRLTNLCASAYLSYRIVHSVVERFPGKISEVPLGCDYDYEYICNVISKYHSNVLAGVNSTFLGLAYHMRSRELVNYKVDRILGGGELLYGSQIELIRQAFPNAEIVSFMFGTTETGALGYSELGDALNEFSIFENACIVEVIDEITRQPIEKPGQVGKCVATSLTRVAAPAIRIDTGDYACWMHAESGKRKLRVIGRKFPFTHCFQGTEFNETDVFELIRYLEGEAPIIRLQLHIYETRLEVIVSLLEDRRFTEKNLKSLIYEGILEQIYALVPVAHLIDCRLEDFSYFLDTTRRKGRLIVDKRDS